MGFPKQGSHQGTGELPRPSERRGGRRGRAEPARRAEQCWFATGFKSQRCLNKEQAESLPRAPREAWTPFLKQRRGFVKMLKGRRAAARAGAGFRGSSCSVGNVRVGSAIPTSLLRRRGGRSCCTGPCATVRHRHTVPCHATREAPATTAGGRGRDPSRAGAGSPSPAHVISSSSGAGTPPVPGSRPALKPHHSALLTASPVPSCPQGCSDPQSPAKNPAALPQQGSFPISPSPTLQEPPKRGREPGRGVWSPPSLGA